MKPLDLQDLESLDRLGRSPDGQRFIELLRMRLDEHSSECRHAEGNDIYRAQGRAQAVEQVLNDLTAASHRLKTLGHR